MGVEEEKGEVEGWRHTLPLSLNSFLLPLAPRPSIQDRHKTALSTRKCLYDQTPHLDPDVLLLAPAEDGQGALHLLHATDHIAPPTGAATLQQPCHGHGDKEGAGVKLTSVKTNTNTYTWKQKCTQRHLRNHIYSSQACIKMS